MIGLLIFGLSPNPAIFHTLCISFIVHFHLKHTKYMEKYI